MESLYHDALLDVIAELGWYSRYALFRVSKSLYRDLYSIIRNPRRCSPGDAVEIALGAAEHDDIETMSGLCSSIYWEMRITTHYGWIFCKAVASGADTVARYLAPKMRTDRRYFTMTKINFGRIRGEGNLYIDDVVSKGCTLDKNILTDFQKEYAREILGYPNAFLNIPHTADPSVEVAPDAE
jgi:hypothetical protein